MSLALIIGSIVAVALPDGAARACTPSEVTQTSSEIRTRSKAVSVDRRCRMQDGGAYDHLTLGPAEDLGNGRVQQVVNGNAFEVLLADCSTREVTILRGRITKTEGDSASCGPIHEYAALTGPAAQLSMAGGKDLHALVAMATAGGATELDPVERFFKFNIGWSSQLYNVGPRDRFNLLCGCGAFYPESPGAKP